MKRFRPLKLYLIVLLALSLLCFCACDESDSPRVIEKTENEVASITICASSGDGEKVFGLFNFGHAFICLTNETDGDLNILGFILPAHKTATISTWSLTKKFGVWFNVESAFIKNRNKYSDRISITAGVTENALKNLDDYLINHNSWSVFNNCTAFSIGLFNALADEQNRIHINGLYTPEKLKTQIKRFEGYESLNKITTDDNIGYLDKDSFVGGFTME